MSKTQEKPKYDFLADLKTVMLSMEKEFLPYQAFQLLHKLKYYVKKYETEVNQTDLFEETQKPNE